MTGSSADTRPLAGKRTDDVALAVLAAVVPPSYARARTCSWMYGSRLATMMTFSPTSSLRRTSRSRSGVQRAARSGALVVADARDQLAHVLGDRRELGARGRFLGGALVAAQQPAHVAQPVVPGEPRHDRHQQRRHRGQRREREQQDALDRRAPLLLEAQIVHQRDEAQRLAGVVEQRDHADVRPPGRRSAPRRTSCASLPARRCRHGATGRVPIARRSAAPEIWAWSRSIAL